MTRPGPRRRPLVAIVATACVAAAGCGARLTTAQHAAGVQLSIRHVVAPGPASPTAVTSADAGPAVPTGPALAQGGGGGAGGPAVPVTPTGGAVVTTGPATPVTSGGRAATSGPAAPQGSSAVTTKAAAGCAAGALTASDTGVTPTTVTINNSADITGPVPGLFTTAQDGVKAFVAYFNATNQTVCGRRLALTTNDSQTSEAGDYAAAQSACTNSFAMVGGDSGFDQGGAPVVQQCGIPDIRASVNSVQRGALANVVAASSDDLHWFEPSIASFFSQKFGATLTQHAAIAYVNIGVGQQQTARYKAGFESQGWKVVETVPIDVADFSYDPFVQKMKADGVDFVFFIAAEAQYARMVKSFQSQSFHPDAFLMNPNGYDTVYTQAAGDAAKGSYVYVDAAPFTDAATNPELQLYLTWLNRVDPSAEPSWFGELSWSATRLFVTVAQQVGPDLTRKAFLAKLRAVKDWTSNGLTSPQPIGAKITGSCWTILQWDGSAWSRVSSPAPYTCTPAALKVSY